MSNGLVTVVLDMHSQVLPLNAPAPATCPTTVTIDATPITPTVAASTSPGVSGFVLIAFDATSPVTPTTRPTISGYYPVLPDEDGHWWDTYPTMYDRMWFDLTTQTNPNSTLVLLASYNLDWGMVPSAEFIQYLFTLGAGSALQDWTSMAKTGSEGSAWVNQPINYGLVGYSGSGFDNKLGEAYGVSSIPAVSTSCTAPIRDPSTAKRG